MRKHFGNAIQERNSESEFEDVFWERNSEVAFNWIVFPTYIWYIPEFSKFVPEKPPKIRPRIAFVKCGSKLWFRVTFPKYYTKRVRKVIVLFYYVHSLFNIYLIYVTFRFIYSHLTSSCGVEFSHAFILLHVHSLFLYQYSLALILP